MRLRRDSALIASILYTIALLWLSPWASKTHQQVRLQFRRNPSMCGNGSRCSISTTLDLRP